ncbi:DUF5958 family protein [Streptomyces sp. NPDC002742]|uniref:DUF5958 family protein n=1 Tax=Streptomyces sp. NPDC002742 TaxID=3364663 RepID=UPI0036A1266D
MCPGGLNWRRVRPVARAPVRALGSRWSERRCCFCATTVSRHAPSPRTDRRASAVPDCAHAHTGSADHTRSDRRSTGEDRFSHSARRTPEGVPTVVAVLAIADGRRRERNCSNGCGHWWHRLSAAD